ncbi:MAG TPA: nitroreductase family protein, partial [Methanoregulaceae archaeon]|nr:nitroreductase family protein [Methanoregulaceae archaeon]
KVTFSDPDRFSEFLSYIRIPPFSVHQYPDGYGVTEIGLRGVQSWLSLLPLRISPARLKNSLSRGLLLRLIRKQAESAAAFGWIATKGSSRHDQVRAGRTYERVHLTAASAGLSLQPMTCVLEPYSGMGDHYRRVLDLLGIPDTHTVQMLFRLGYSHSSSQSRRRDVQDFLGDTE